MKVIRNKSKLFSFGIIVLTASLLYCCTKDEVSHENQANLDVNIVNQNIDEISQLIAVATGKSTALRKALKNEIAKKFDYDHDALLLSFIGMEIEGETFEQMLSKESDGAYTAEEIAQKIQASGYLQISIPVHFDLFDPEIHTPITVAIPADTKENTGCKFIGYNMQGEVMEVSSEFSPEDPVFAIMVSERIDITGKLIVNESNICVSKAKRIHFSEAVINANKRSQLKSSALRGILDVVSDDEYASLIEKNKSKSMLPSSLKSSGEYKIINGINYKMGLSPFSVQFSAVAKSENRVELNWCYPAGTNKVVICRTGWSHAHRAFKEDLPIATFSDGSTTATNNTNYPNHEYTYYAKFYNGNQLISTSNKGTAHTSHRRNNGGEYLKGVIATKQMVSQLEGWWASELELAFTINYINWEGKNIDHEQPSFPVDTDGKGRLRDVNWRGSKLLFNWDRQGYNYGAYTFTLVEKDRFDNRTKKINLIMDWIRYGLDESGRGEYVELVDRVDETIKVLSEDDKIGYGNIKWWDPNDQWRELHPKGFSIKINHR